jgi:DNA repair protein RecO (recombination protein O)
MEEKTPGLLLQSIPYLGQKRILKVFTPAGLISLFAKKSSLTPFCLAEWVYPKTEKDLYPLRDTTLLDPLSELRQNYALLTAAGSIAKDILRSQLPHKSAPELYRLACLYFKKLPQAPDTLAASFRLKLLLHEGLLSCEREPIFTPTEWEQVQVLAFTRHFSALYELPAVPTQKIALLFEERLTQN